MWLVDYPKYMVAEEYRVPEYVTKIEQAALQHVKSTNKVYIPATVQSFSSYLFHGSNYEEIYLQDGISMPSSTSLILYQVTALKTIHWSENANYSL